MLVVMNKFVEIVNDISNILCNYERSLKAIDTLKLYIDGIATFEELTNAADAADAAAYAAAYAADAAAKEMQTNLQLDKLVEILEGK